MNDDLISPEELEQLQREAKTSQELDENRELSQPDKPEPTGSAQPPQES